MLIILLYIFLLYTLLFCFIFFLIYFNLLHFNLYINVTILVLIILIYFISIYFLLCLNLFCFTFQLFYCNFFDFVLRGKGKGVAWSPIRKNQIFVWKTFPEFLEEFHIAVPRIPPVITLRDELYRRWHVWCYVTVIIVTKCMHPILMKSLCIYTDIIFERG